MIQYIYFVKCPGCEDEHFDFFNEAKDFAMGCLAKKPIITQTEIDRNDFGECVDSNDLGTVWSWEEMMSDVPDDSELTTFSKADTLAYNYDFDPELDALDNSLDSVPDNFRKPIPADMSIDALVEEMEENEDTVECKYCNELFDKSECRKEVGLGWLCNGCQSAIMSSGKPLTSWTCFFDGEELGVVKANDEEEAYSRMEQTWPELDYGRYDGIATVEPLTEAATDIFPKDLNRFVTLTYPDMTVSIVTKVIPATLVDPEDYEEEEYTDEFEYEVFLGDVATVLYENFMTDEDVAQVPGGFEALEDDDVFLDYMRDNFDSLFEKYYSQLLDYYEEEATEAAKEKWQQDYDESEPDPDEAYDSWRDNQLFGESLKESDIDLSGKFDLCPECGSEQAFDHRAGFCINCGFNI